MENKTENKSLKRVAFLAEQYNVLSVEEFDMLLKDSEDSNENFLVSTSINDNELKLAIINTVIKKESVYEGVSTTSYKKIIKIHEDVFINMVQADPTTNKIYLQWMLTVFSRLLKEGEIRDAIRFASEDLMIANEFLILFEGNKRKELFKQLCKSNSDLLNISDPTNINQYRNLGQVFDVIDPFIERDPSNMEVALKRFVKAGQAEMPVRDRFFTVYIPLTESSSEVLSKFTKWCTTRPSNGMVKHYTNMKTPSGHKSKLYVIIDNKFFTGESEELWQLHFESSQIMDRKDESVNNIYDKVFEKSEILSNFFYNELITNAKLIQSKSPKGHLNYNTNYYLNALTKIGFADAMFDIENCNTPSLTFSEELIPKLPDLSRFKSVELIYIGYSKLKELHNSISNLSTLKQLSIPNNRIEELPSYLGNCKNLIFINLVGNKIKAIPNDISKLDPSNGGNLIKISVKKDDIGEENYNKLKKLLPNVEVGFAP